MVQRICPICDQAMKSAHYCKNCKSWVKHPYVRDAAYYLNERHPQDETGCSYHDMDSQRVLRAEQKVMRQPSDLPGKTGSNMPSGASASPDGVWKPVGVPKPPGMTQNTGMAQHPGMAQDTGMAQRTVLPQRTAFPEKVPLPPVRPVYRAGESAMGGGRPRRSGSSAVIGLFLVAAVVSVLASFSGQMFDVVRGIMEPPVEYDIDLGDYTGEDSDIGYQELDEGDVAARGERCNARGHFSVQGRQMEQPVLDILERAGLQVKHQDTYSYNEAYDNGETWYTTWTSIRIVGEEEDSYQYVELDYDTGTGELHEISLSLNDPKRLTSVTCEILTALAGQGEIDADADCLALVAEELPAAISRGEDYNLLEGAVVIEGFSYEDTYSVYISHNIDGTL